MHIAPTPLPGVLLLKPERFYDPRGFFVESYHRARLAETGIGVDFVQDNLSFSKRALTLRGLHFQREPFAQAKLVSVITGAGLDIVVDLRRNSPHFGQHLAKQLRADEGNQLFIPVGFAHGFLSVEADTLLAYKVSNYYSPEHDAGIRFDDPKLAIDWGFCPDELLISDKDRRLPYFDPGNAYFA